MGQGRFPSLGLLKKPSEESRFELLVSSRGAVEVVLSGCGTGHPGRLTDAEKGVELQGLLSGSL